MLVVFEFDSLQLFRRLFCCLQVMELDMVVQPVLPPNKHQHQEQGHQEGTLTITGCKYPKLGSLGQQLEPLMLTVQ